MLESQNKLLKKKVSDLESKRKPFRIDDISENDSLTRLYTGLVSFRVLKAFYEFLGPSVNELCYWGGRKVTTQKRRQPTKLNPIVSNYVITCINFLYHHLHEIQWMPSIQQVVETLPHSFRSKHLLSSMEAKYFIRFTGTVIHMERL